MSDLEVRQLRYFVAVAEELHFGRAAERLGMAQPPLSRAIGTLERRLGATLLRRTTRQVTLTAAGEAFLADARIALDAVAAAEHRARNAGRATPALRLALKADYDAGLLPMILDVFARDPAARPVELIMGGRGEQVPALRDGRADVAILPTPFDDVGLDWEPLVTEPRLLAVAANDPLAGRAELRLNDLTGRTQPDDLPEDDRPRDLGQMFSLIGLGRLVWYVPASIARRNRRSDIAYREVIDLPPTTLTVAWPQTSRSAAVAAFVRAATAVAGSADGEAEHLGAAEASRVGAGDR